MLRKLKKLFCIFCAQRTLKLIMSSCSWAFIYFLYTEFDDCIKCCPYYIQDRIKLAMGREEISNFMRSKSQKPEKTIQDIFLLLPGIGVCQFLDQIKIATCSWSRSLARAVCATYRGELPRTACTY